MKKTRLVGILLLLASLVSFGFDLARSVMRGQDFRFRDTGEVWAMIHRDSLLALQPAVERYLTPWLWDPVILSVLTTPLSLILLVLSGFFIIAGASKLRLGGLRG